MRIAVALAVALALGLTACGGSDGEAVPNPDGPFAVRASSDVAVGSSRLLVGIAMADGTRLGSPDDPVSFRIAPLDDPEAVRTFPAAFVWIVEGVNGVYAATIETDRAGGWSVEVVPDDGTTVAPSAFEVFEEPLTPAVGTPGIRVASPTTADHAIEEITTDPEPDPRFYELSLDEALDSGRPTVVVFATPAFCQTAACGPMLEIVKEAADAHPGVDFVHVEVYEGFREPGFAPDASHLAPAVRAWGLPSEPWVFVTDASGVVTAKFEGVLSPGELAEALAAAAS